MWASSVRAACTCADPLLHPAHVVDRVIRLHLGDDAEPAEAVEVVGLDHLRVNHPEPAIARAIMEDGRLEHVEQRVDRQITDRVDLR